MRTKPRLYRVKGVQYSRLWDKYDMLRIELGIRGIRVLFDLDSKAIHAYKVFEFIFS